MSKQKHTNEFSIIGLLDSRAAQDIKKIREDMPASPYRDDPPHLTLVYEVRTSENVSDHELMLKLQPIIDEALSVPVHAKVKKVVNRRGDLYGTTSLILLELTPEFKAHRKKLIRSLRAHGFKTNHWLDRFIPPHASIRLGVPTTGGSRREAARLFPPGRGVNVTNLEIYRLVSRRSLRLFYLIKLPKHRSRTLA